MLKSHGRREKGFALSGRLSVLGRSFALALLALSSWSLNAHLFPLYDTQLSSIRELCTLSNGVALALFAVVSTCRPRMLRNQVLACVASCGVVGGSLLVWAGDQSGLAGVMLAGACLISVAEGACTILVGIFLCSIPKKPAAASIVAGLLLCDAAKQVCPVGYSELALAVHAALLLGAILLANPTARETVEKLSQGESPHDMAITQPLSFLPFGHRLFMCLLLFSAVQGFMLTFGETGGIPAVSPWSLAVLLLLLATACWFPRRLTSDALLKLAMLLAIAGLLLVPASGLTGFFVSNGLISCGIAVFSVFQWIVLTTLARRNAHGAVSAFAWGSAMHAVGVILGANAGRFVNHYWTSDVQVVVLAVAVIVFCLVAFMTILLQHVSFEKTISEVRESAPLVIAAPAEDAVEERALTIDERCDAVSRQHGLTKRETEVLRLLARGRTGVFIRHELCVSYNTVKAHVKHIYQKLDVHTHQELIDLVEDYE
ncbi:helix-turn-helix transcriptional regulator [Gordonibacter sp. An230]|uniref:response regulator transcription factor n=1 Tax=Gordonibacter sp. An230 TaxID=1965592 RepID=UPI000B36A4C6|nr:helix-turn-helix transcriptional regulator [Gordonibacter sp. An230]OUO89852.1 helix-turn-helix transcriptional regulator [Gordonibacter sp. An230]